MVKPTRHDNKGYKYANEWFERPHRWMSDQQLNQLSPGQRWPGLDIKRQPQKEPGEELTPQIRKPAVPLELKPRRRRKSGEA